MYFPVKLKDMIDPEVYRIYDIDSQMTFNRAKEMVKGVITNNKHFSTNNNCISSFHHDQFMPKTVIYGVLVCLQNISWFHIIILN